MTSDAGGSSTAGLRLHQALQEQGHQSSVLARDYSAPNVPGVLPYVEQVALPIRLLKKLRRRRINGEFWTYLNTRPAESGMFSDDRSVLDVQRDALVSQADVINLHWVAGFIDHSRFFPLAIRKPVVWSLHDMNPFTGGCYFSGECRRYLDRCGNCPELGSTSTHDLSSSIWERKHRAYSRELVAVSPSGWLEEAARSSSLFKDVEVQRIPYGLPLDRFRRMDAQASRSLFSIPADKTVILFGAADISNQRKGLAYLYDSLRMLCAESALKNVVLAVFGGGSTRLPVSPDLPVIHLGNVKDERLMPFCYSAADVFVIPSLADNLPNTILEAMACELPVVAFDVGGIPDMVRSGQTGLLAEPRNSIDLAHHLRWIVEHPEHAREFGRNGRRVVEKEYDVRLMARRYSELYSDLLQRRTSKTSAHV